MSESEAVVRGRRFSQAEGESLVREYEQSGLRRKAFCSLRGVAIHTLDYYRHRDRIRSSSPSGQLVAVELVGPSPEVSGLRVELSNGRCIVVEAGFDASHLKRLLSVLEN